MGSFHITTFGCQMNKSDSERISSLLTSVGLTESSSDEHADVIIYNTCSVRQKSEDRMYGIHHTLTGLKERHPERVIAITGCMAGRDHDGRIRKRLSAVDLFFPTEEMVHLPRWISELNQNIIDPNTVSSSEYEHYLKIRPSYSKSFQGYLAISNGCNKFCTYCVVPYARGRQKDRPAADVLDEARKLADTGCLEITLLGQTVNLYNPPDKETAFRKDNPFDRTKNCFAALMWEVNQINGIERIHFTAPHPQYMDDQTIAALTMQKNINYLHLPVQSGSNATLKRMNRPYSREYYIETIEKIKKAKPGIAIGTDIIVGFCGETEEDFEETLDLYRVCDFDIAYNAQYSVRSGTAASRMFKDDVPPRVKKERWNRLHTLMEDTVLRKNQQYIGTDVSVLVESCEKGLCSGNSREMKRVVFRGSETMIGTVIPVKVERAVEWVLYGVNH